MVGDVFVGDASRCTVAGSVGRGVAGFEAAVAGRDGRQALAARALAEVVGGHGRQYTVARAACPDQCHRGAAAGNVGEYLRSHTVIRQPIF